MKITQNVNAMLTFHLSRLLSWRVAPGFSCANDSPGVCQEVRGIVELAAANGRTMPSPLHTHCELIHTLSVVQKQSLAQVVAALQDRGVKTSAPTLSRYLRSTEFTDYASGSRAIYLQPAPQPPVLPAPVQTIASPPPPAPRQSPGDTEILLDQNLDLLAELAGKIEGHSLTVTELERFMRGEMADFLRQQKAELVPAPPFDPATVRSIWARAFVVTGLLWFAIIAAAGVTARFALAP